MCLIHVLVKLPLGTSYSAVGQELNVNDPIIYIKRYRKHKGIYRLVNKNVPRSLEEFKPAFSLGTATQYSLIQVCGDFMERNHCSYQELTIYLGWIIWKM